MGIETIFFLTLHQQDGNVKRDKRHGNIRIAAASRGTRERTLKHRKS